ncbi:MAG TPA: tetratricopeptide repeat protein, partial [Anaerolineae bacterium]|nr:tetratricopeptide repeat protein [Anaerolineae bacterium]
ARYQQWQAAYQARVGGPRRRRPAEPESRQPQPQAWSERPERQPVQAERGSTYTVIRAGQCAIGDYALVINNIGTLPLRWKRPAEGRPRLARAAVGRQAELDELHRRLTAGKGAAVVGRGTSAALRGQPAIGKTTLAAMYAARYGDRYPGGVLWLEVGPDRRSAADALPILQRIAAYAYAADAQAQTMLANTAFAPDLVRALLRGHGPMLVVIDDVWDPAILRELQDGLPDQAVVLLTTRKYDVAYALENNPAAIQELDVLSPPDARLLLQRGAPGLSDELADRLAKGLGRHALALTLAAGALAFRKAHRYEQTAAALLRRVAAGEGFGDLPRMDREERLTEVEIAFKYSYDELGRGADGATRQAWFRALGAFAPEADFDTGAAAAVWELERATAQEFLLGLEGLSLLHETAADRWQQHALLRAYALSLQRAGERIRFPERHADYYLALTRACYERKPRDYDRVEREFAQIQHAFAWCRANSPRRTTGLALLLSDFMRVRSRVGLLDQWLRAALQGAEVHGDRLGKANTLQSLGDLELRLGNLAQARSHYDAALPLYEAEQDRLGKANTLQSLGDLELRLGNLAQARSHYDAALPLYEAEQNPIGKMNTWISLARLEAGLGNLAKAGQYYQRTFDLAEQIDFGDHPVTRDLRQEYAQLGQARQLSPDEISSVQQLADLLIAWIQTPDWAQSEAYLQEHAADLLGDEAEAALALLRQANPDAETIPVHQALLRRCREIGIEAAYREFRAALAVASLLPGGRGAGGRGEGKPKDISKRRTWEVK